MADTPEPPVEIVTDTRDYLSFREIARRWTDMLSRLPDRSDKAVRARLEECVQSFWRGEFEDGDGNTLVFTFAESSDCLGGVVSRERFERGERDGDTVYLPHDDRDIPTPEREISPSDRYSVANTLAVRGWLPDTFSPVHQSEVGSSLFGVLEITGLDAYLESGEWSLAEGLYEQLSIHKQVFRRWCESRGWPPPIHLCGEVVEVDTGPALNVIGPQDSPQAAAERAPVTVGLFGESPADDAGEVDAGPTVTHIGPPVSPEVEAMEVSLFGGPSDDGAREVAAGEREPQELEREKISGLSRRDEQKQRTQAKYERWNSIAQTVKGERKDGAPPLSPLDIARQVDRRVRAEDNIARDSKIRGLNPESVKRRLNQHFPGWSTYDEAK